MDKKVYLKNRFKKDFIRYSLLQEDSITAAEIAETLYGVLSINDILYNGKQQIEFICNEQLSFEKVKNEELNYDLKDLVVSTYKEWLNGYSIQQIVNEQVGKVEKSVELQAWGNGVSNMSDAIKLFVERLDNASTSYNSLIASTITEKDLLEKFTKAKDITLIEHVTGSNIEDVIAYRSMLLQYVKESCVNMLYAKIEEVYSALASNVTFERMQSNFSAISEYALQLQATIENFEANVAWDTEYNRLVPIDFYSRNVENITAEQAYHMVLLQIIAKNEEWMVENGLLVDGELKVFVGEVTGIKKLFEMLSLKL